MSIRSEWNQWMKDASSRDEVRQWHAFLKSRDKLHTPSIPRTIGRYTILRLISVGGMGIVYEAIEPFPERRIAIKVMRSNLMSPQARRRFRNEANFLARLQHPRIAGIYEANLEFEQPFIAMEYVQGDRLLDYVVLHDLNTREKLLLILQIAQAVHYAHEHGVLHRDLKPANILVDLEGNIKILDFGLSLALSQEHVAATLPTTIGHAIGTLPYMSPEQISKQATQIDSRSDLYTLGIVGYELLVGHRPYSLSGKSLPESLRIICEQTPIPLSKSNPSLRGDLEKIFLKALEKAPEDRYRNIALFADDIERFLAGKPVVARPVGSLGRLTRWIRREPKFALLLGTLLLILSLTTVGATLALRIVDHARLDALTANNKLKDSLFREQNISQNESTLRKLTDELLKKSRRQLYASEITDAYLAFTRGDFVAVNDILDRQTPKQAQEDLRGFEWQHLYNTMNSATQVLYWHQSPVRSVAFSPDGRWLASGSQDGQFILTDTSTWQPVLMDSTVTAPIHTLEFNPESNLLAIGDQTGDVRLVNLHTQSVERILQGHYQPVHALRFLPEQPVLLAATGGISEVNPTAYSTGYIHRWTLNLPNDSPEIISQFPSQISSLDIAKNQVACTTWNGRVLWNSDSFDLPPSWLPDDIDHSTKISFSPNGKTLAIVGWNEELKLWDVENKEYTSFAIPNSATCVRFAPDGQDVFIATRRESVLLRWNVKTKQVEDVYYGHTRLIRDVAVSPDARSIATASADGSVRIWQRSKSQGIRRLRGHSDEIDAIAISKDSNFVLSGSRDQSARLWNLKSAHTIESWNPDPYPVRAVDISTNNKWIATGSQKVHIWNATSGKELRSFEIPNGYVRSLKFSPDDAFLIAGTHIDATSTSPAHGHLLLWSTNDWSPITSWASTDTEAVWAMAHSNDGKWFASGGTSGNITIRDASTGNIHHQWQHTDGWISSMVFSPDASQLAVGVWDIAGKQISSAPVSIWDVTHARRIALLEGHSQAVFAMDYSPDSNRLVTGGTSGDLKFWDAQNYRLCARVDIPKTGWILAAKFLPNGQGLLCTTGRQRDQCEVLLLDLADIPFNQKLTSSSQSKSEDEPRR